MLIVVSGVGSDDDGGRRVSEEPAGFREYVVARHRALLKTAWLMTGDWQTAEDLVQSSLAKLWPKWDRVRDTGDPDGYVRRILVNTYATWWRLRWRSERPLATLPDQADTVDGYVTVDLRDALERLLHTLSRRQRAVIVLRYYEDLSETQTAEMLGCSVGTVKSTAARALVKLRVADAVHARHGEEKSDDEK